MKKYFENTGHLNDNGFALYVDALRTGNMERLPAPLVDHVSECNECKQGILGLKVVIKDQKLSIDEPHPFFKKTHAKKYFIIPYRIAASLLFFAFLGVFIYYLTQDTNDTGIIKERYAENFVPLPIYESLVDQDLRSLGLVILSPEAETEVTNGIEFQWEIRYDDPLILSILNNRGEPILEESLTEDRYYFDDFPAPGLYYWRLRTEDRLLHVGKFFVPAEHR